MSGKIFAFLVALLVIPCFVYADDIANQAGPFELEVGGSGANDRNFRAGDFTLNGEFGVFILPIIELSARDAVSYTDLPHTHPSWGNTVDGAIDLEIPIDRFEPYVGGNVGYACGTAAHSTGEAAPEIGLKIFFDKSVFVFGQMEYDFFFNNTHSTFDTGEFVYTVGLGLRF
jgi:hypothetical protein